MGGGRGRQRKMLRESTDAHRKAAWQQVEAAGRWAVVSFGERFSAL
jgi:hypothetical protein